MSYFYSMKYTYALEPSVRSHGEGGRKPCAVVQREGVGGEWG